MLSLKHINRVFPLKGGPVYALRDIDHDLARDSQLSHYLQ
jgi:hypothetical protein